MKVKVNKQSWGVMAFPRRRDGSLPVGTRPQNPNPDSLQWGLDKSLPPGHAVGYMTDKETPIQTLTCKIGNKSKMFPQLTEALYRKVTNRAKHEWNDLFMSIHSDERRLKWMKQWDGTQAGFTYIHMTIWKWLTLLDSMTKDIGPYTVSKLHFNFTQTPLSRVGVTFE